MESNYRDWRTKEDITLIRPPRGVHFYLQLISFVLGVGLNALGILAIAWPELSIWPIKVCLYVLLSIGDVMWGTDVHSNVMNQRVISKILAWPPCFGAMFLVLGTLICAEGIIELLPRRQCLWIDHKRGQVYVRPRLGQVFTVDYSNMLNPPREATEKEHFYLDWDYVWESESGVIGVGADWENAQMLLGAHGDSSYS